MLGYIAYFEIISKEPSGLKQCTMYILNIFQIVVNVRKVLVAQLVPVI